MCLHLKTNEEDMHHLTCGINSLLHSVNEPHCVHSPPGSPHPTYIT